MIHVTDFDVWSVFPLVRSKLRRRVSNVGDKVKRMPPSTTCDADGPVTSTYNAMLKRCSNRSTGFRAAEGLLIVGRLERGNRRTWGKVFRVLVSTTRAPRLCSDRYS